MEDEETNKRHSENVWKEKHPTAVSNLKRNILLHEQILTKYEQEVLNCKVLREDNIKLINRINALEQANFQKENEIKQMMEEHLKHQVLTMEKHFLIQQNSISEKEDEIQQLRHQMSHLEHLLDIERKKYNELRSHSDELYQKYIDREISIKETEIKYIKANEELFSVREELEMIGHRLKVKQSENEKMKSTYLKLNTDCETLKIEVDDLHSKFDALNQKYVDTQKSLTSSEETLKTVTMEHSQVKEQLKTNVSQLTSVEKSKLDLENRVQELEQVNANYGSMIEKLGSEKTEAQANVQQLKIRCENLAKQVAQSIDYEEYEHTLKKCQELLKENQQLHNQCLDWESKYTIVKTHLAHLIQQQDGEIQRIANQVEDRSYAFAKSSKPNNSNTNSPTSKYNSSPQRKSPSPSPYVRNNTSPSKSLNSSQQLNNSQLINATNQLDAWKSLKEELIKVKHRNVELAKQIMDISQHKDDTISKQEEQNQQLKNTLYELQQQLQTSTTVSTPTRTNRRASISSYTASPVRKSPLAAKKLFESNSESSSPNKQLV